MSILSFDIARRYLYGKKSTNSINIITGISIFGISIGTAALILILSVFNGFEGLLSGLFNAFNPDLKVSPAKGKFFELPDDTYTALLNIEGVNSISRTIEEVALFEYKGSKEIGVIKGVDENYLNVTSLDSLINNGKYLLREDNIQYAIIGSGMRNKLSLNIDDKLSTVTIYMPQKKKKFIGGKEFTSRDVYPSGVFSVRSEADYQYIITNLDFVSGLLDERNKVSFLEIKTDPAKNSNTIQKAVKSLLGEDFVVKDRYEQDEAYLKVMEIEKWITFLITGLTIVLIAFNLIGALWMIVLDKQKDIAVLKAMGYNSADVQKLYLSLGIFITLVGIILGIFLGLIGYFLQKEFGIIGLAEGFLIDSYPVKLKVQDFFITGSTVLFIGFLASILPSYKASRTESVLKSK